MELDAMILVFECWVLSYALHSHLSPLSRDPLFPLHFLPLGWFSSVQLLSRVRLFVTPWTAACLGLPVHRQLPKFIQTHVHWVGDAIQPSHALCPLLLLPSIFPSISVFSNESALFIRWPKYWSFSFSISPSNEYLGLISFRMDWLDLLEV